MSYTEDFEKVEQAMRELYRSGNSKTHKLSDGSRVQSRNFGYWNVVKLLDVLEEIFTGVQEQAEKPSAEEIEQVRKKWVELKEKQYKREHDKFRVKQLGEFLERWDNYD